jgi:hypothetical protein
VIVEGILAAKQIESLAIVADALAVDEHRRHGLA